MDITHIADWFDIGYKMLTALFMGWMFLDRKGDQIHARVDKIQALVAETEKSIDKRLDGHSNRLSRIESDIENAVGIDDIKVIHARVDKIHECTAKTAGQVEILVKSVEMISQNLIRSK